MPLTYLTTAAVAAAVGSVFGLGPAAAEPIRISYANVNANFAPTFAAEDKGYFKQEGLDVELINAPGGTATPALMAGSLNYSASTSSAMSAILKGAPLKVVFVGTSRALYQLWSFDPEVASFAQMKGKSVPIAQRGGTEELAMRVYLKAKGLPPDYLTMIPLGTGTARLASILGGTQKAAMLTSGEMGAFKEAGLLDKGRMIVDFSKEIETQNGGIVTTTKAVTENRDEVKKVLRALWKGTLYMQAQKQGMTDILQKRLPTTSRDQLLSGIDAAVEDVDTDGEMPMAAAAKELGVRAELLNVPQDKVPPPEQVYDFSIIREVIKELEAENWRPTK